MMLLLIPILPIISALALCFRVPVFRKYPGAISVLFTSISWVMLVFLYGNEINKGMTWFQSGGLELTFSFVLDGFVWLIAMIVSSVGLLVSIFSVKFIKERRLFYFRVLSFFLGSMLTLVLSGSFILMFIAWEFVGLSSFLLIGISFREESSRQAARKAFLMTRVGDFGFLMALLIILGSSGSTDISGFLSLVNEGSFSARYGLEAVGFLFLLAALGKSAQLPFTSWLPDAMAGPAPVSALIHSATMVAAGVFLLLKLFPLYEAAPFVLKIILWTGFITSLFAALTATARYDIKRILAWSTISQLGEMFFAVGMTGALAATFHLSTHAFFKAGLFLCAGIIAHLVGSRDLREINEKSFKMPFLYAGLIILSLALAGLPPFSGFWSEEEIIADALKHGPLYAVMMLSLIFLAGIYISRLAVISAKHGFFDSAQKEEQVKTQLYPILVFALVSIIIGFILKPLLEQLTGFSKPPSPGWFWRILAIIASVGGLAFGSLSAMKKGANPALGNIFTKLPVFSDVFVKAPVHAVRIISFFVNSVEKLFDKTARTINWLVTKLAESILKPEKIADDLARFVSVFTLALSGIKGQAENKFARFANISSLYTIRSSFSVEHSEEYLFGKGGDKFANLFSATGGKARKAQTGKIFNYVLLLFLALVTALVVTGIFYPLI